MLSIIISQHADIAGSVRMMPACCLRRSFKGVSLKMNYEIDNVSLAKKGLSERCNYDILTVNLRNTGTEAPSMNRVIG